MLLRIFLSWDNLRRVCLGIGLTQFRACSIALTKNREPLTCSAMAAARRWRHILPAISQKERGFPEAI